MPHDSQALPTLCFDPVYSRFLLRPHLGLAKFCKLLQGANPMETQNILDGLKKDKQKIREQIKDLEADLQATHRLIRRHSQNGAKPNPATVGGPSFKPKEAAKHLVIQAGPKKRWTPTGMRDELVKLREQGRLLSKAKDLLPPSHGLLSSLVKDGLLVSAGKGKYRLKP